MAPTRTLILLVDALAATSLERRKGSVINQLALEGVSAAIVPAPLYPGCDDFVFGVPPAVHGNWLNYAYTGLAADFATAPRKTLLTDVVIDCIDTLIPRRNWARPLRAAWHRVTLQPSPEHPQFFPRHLLPHLTRVRTNGNLSSLFDRLEQQGIRTRWYTRDCPLERHKRWGGRLFRMRFQRRLLEWIVSSCDQVPVAYAELSTLLDRTGHAHGPHSKIMDRAFAAVDSDLGFLYEQFRKQSPNGLFIVLSDHGMSAVSHVFDVERTLARAGLQLRSDYMAILHGTVAHVRCRSAGHRDRAERVWQQEGGVVVDNAALISAGYPSALGQYDLLLAVPPGAVISPNHFNGNSKLHGMHGYWHTADPDAYAAFVMHGAGTGRLRSGTRLIDLHRIVLESVLTGTIPRAVLDGNGPQA